jgi:hypothetical protein
MPGLGLWDPVCSELDSDSMGVIICSVGTVDKIHLINELMYPHNAPNMEVDTVMTRNPRSHHTHKNRLLLRNDRGKGNQNSISGANSLRLKFWLIQSPLQNRCVGLYASEPCNMEPLLFIRMIIGVTSSSVTVGHHHFIDKGRLSRSAMAYLRYVFPQNFTTRIRTVKAMSVTSRETLV